jgi:glycosyltransferase involved in cell wall biosynthesis
MSLMRPALLNPVFWPEVRRGSERVVRDLADGLLDRGHEPRLITSHRGLRSSTVEDGLRIVRTPRLPEGRLRRRGYEDHLTHIPFTARELRGGDDDLAHGFHPTDAAVAARWSRRTGRPAVFSFMGLAHRAGLANRRRRAELTVEAARGCQAVVALSRTAAAAFERWVGVGARVIHPGVDLAAFAPGGDRHPLPTIICAADIADPRKGVAQLVGAFERVRRDRPDARLVLNRPRDPAIATALANGESVEFADLDDREELAAAYRAAWVSALPSHSEAFGLVLVEALACGTPVVGGIQGSFAEIVDSAAIGAMADPTDEQALARALLHAFDLAGDPETPAVCRARAEQFSVERMVQAYEGLYRELLASR